MAYTYILQCRDNTYYVGWTMDVENRLKAHNGEAPGGAKYTQGRRPVVLVWHAFFEDKREAQRLEWKLKHMTRRQKERYIKEHASGEIAPCVKS